MSISLPSSKNHNHPSGILTIGIPVFEEEEGLAETLSSIGNLEEFKSGEIEVVVWDNNSPDSSYRVASKFAMRSPETVIVGRNSSNLGALENIRQVFLNSTSKYVWILGAGEEILLTSLAPLINLLGNSQNSSLSMGTVNVEAKSGAEKVSDTSWKIESFEPETKSCFVETISLSIVRRELGLSVLGPTNSSNNDKFRLWPHLEMALAAASERTFTVSSPPLVRVSENPTGWWYHSVNALGIYLNQVMLLRAHPGKIGWVQDRLMDRAGWHFAKFAFEIKLEGAGLRPSQLSEARRAGIQLAPLFVAIAISLSPKAPLRLAQSLFRWLRTK